jgi:hypothetical protein
MATLESIANETTSCALLNALHACREDHPLHNTKAYRNAFVIAMQHLEISRKSLDWLKEQADKETKRWA